MALIKCSECGKEISSTVTKCPHCGKKNINPKAVAIVLVIFIVASIWICSGSKKDKPVQSSGSTVDSTNSKFIPGITAADITLNLTNKGFVLTKDISTPYSTWSCKEETSSFRRSVDVFGSGPMNIISITATCLNFTSPNTDKIAKDFLAYVASTPYERSSPEMAKQWVLDSVGKNTSATFGNAKFTLFANSKLSRVLVISPRE